MAFVVAATWMAKPGKEQHIREIIELLTPLSRAEPANLFYQAQVHPDEPGTFFLYELYTDADAYEAHKAAGYFQEHVFNDAIHHLESREVKTYYTIDA